MRSATPAIAVLICIAAAGAVQSAHGQVVTGRVLEEATDRPLADVEVRLETTGGRATYRAVTDSTGAFSVRAPRFGSFVLVASMIGMATVSTEPFDVGEGTMTVVLRMSTSAVPLDPLTVEARGGAADLGVLSGYYERMRSNQRLGIGRFVTRDEIDARSPMNVSDLLRAMPRVNVNHGGRGTGAFVTMRAARGECTPALYIDGARANRRDRAFIDEMVRPMDVEGVEVYVGLAQMPGMYHDENNCGVLLVWTRRGSDEGRPFSWTRAALGIGLLGSLLFMMR
jgi:hypothetical protein